MATVDVDTIAVCSGGPKGLSENRQPPGAVLHSSRKPGLLLPPPKEVTFSLLYVCLFVCPSDS